MADEGLTGTYLFELEAHPGEPQGRSVMITGSKPIPTVEQPRRGQPWSRSFLSLGTIADTSAAASPYARKFQRNIRTHPLAIRVRTTTTIPIMPGMIRQFEKNVKPGS